MATLFSALGTFGLGFLAGWLARNLRIADPAPTIQIHTTERRQMLCKSGDL